MTHCTNCGRKTARPRNDLCSACYQYQRDHGTARPRYLWREGRRSRRKVTTATTICKNCGRSSYYLRGGRCGACYNYHRKHGHDRPADAVDAPICECGAPAVVEMDLNCNGVLVRYQLCRACAAVEREAADAVA